MKGLSVSYTVIMDVVLDLTLFYSEMDSLFTTVQHVSFKYTSAIISLSFTFTLGEVQQLI